MELDDRRLETYGESFLQSFEAIRRALSLYPGNHPKVAEQLDRFVANLATAHRELEQATVNVVDREFYLNGLPLKRLSLSYARSLATWEELGLGLVRFAGDTSREDSLRFFEILNRGPEALRAAGGVAAEVARAGLRGIHVSGVAMELGGDLQSVFDQPSLAVADASQSSVARARYLDSRALLTSLAASARATAGTPARVLRTASILLDGRLGQRPAVGDLLQELRDHHAPSWRHALDGAAVAVAMGRTLGLGRERLLLLGEAAALRETGRLTLSAAEIEGWPRDPAVRVAFEQHPVEGARRLLATPLLDPSAAIVALEQHAGFDLSGFPALGRGRSLHPFSRIVAVAAVYDLMAGQSTPAAERLTPPDALKRLVAGAGTSFDPAAVRSLVATIGLYPEGTVVRLVDGRRAIVVGVGDTDWSRPEVAALEGRPGARPTVVRTSILAAPGQPVVAEVLAPTSADAEAVKSLG